MRQIKILRSFMIMSAMMISANTAFTQNAPQLIGDWKGESICQVKNSPCHDETVVYHISKEKGPGKFQIIADKIVDGKMVNMGTLDFTYEEENKALVCTFKNGTFRLIIAGNKMEGTLVTADKILYRRISLLKVE